MTTDLPKMKPFPLIDIKPEFREYMAERKREHDEVVARGPVEWRVRIPGSGKPRLVIEALYARDAAAKFASSELDDDYDDETVTLEVVGPDGAVTMFEVDTEVVRQRIVIEVPQP
jgi:hypothetical protein